MLFFIFSEGILGLTALISKIAQKRPRKETGKTNKRKEKKGKEE